MTVGSIALSRQIGIEIVHVGDKSKSNALHIADTGNLPGLLHSAIQSRSSMDARIAMIAITTRSSINVKKVPLDFIRSVTLSFLVVLVRHRTV